MITREHYTRESKQDEWEFESSEPDGGKWALIVSSMGWMRSLGGTEEKVGDDMVISTSPSGLEQTRFIRT